MSVNEIHVVKPFITVEHDSTAFQLNKILIQLPYTQAWKNWLKSESRHKYYGNESAYVMAALLQQLCNEFGGETVKDCSTSAQQ